VSYIQTAADLPGFCKNSPACHAYFCILEVVLVPIGAPSFKDAEFAVNMKEKGNSSYPPTALNTSILVSFDS